ncbi:MAG TPA: DUF72 domain-containing protein [Polyangiaceae bacterium]|nr:DUF72 domain-containing protein [Polyangiaceae bacterium]
MNPGTAYIGISGFRYPPWRGVFYPPGLKQAAELEYASLRFASIEINGSFYSLMRPETCQAWYEQTPQHFVFGLKGSRYITHLKRLKGVEAALSNFFASGLLRLREKLGPLLWQLPPQLGFDPERLSAFFRLLPRSTREAAALAERHDHRLAGRSEVRAFHDMPLRHALEVRHPSYAQPAFIELARKFRIAVCVADSAGLFPSLFDVTADFMYVRLHGATELYTSGYGARALERWAQAVNAWRHGDHLPRARLISAPSMPAQARDVFVYFDNDVKVRAPFDALNLQRVLDGKRVKRLPPALRTVTETPRRDWAQWQAAQAAGTEPAPRVPLKP